MFVREKSKHNVRQEKKLRRKSDYWRASNEKGEIEMVKIKNWKKIVFNDTYKIVWRNTKTGEVVRLKREYVKGRGFSSMWKLEKRKAGQKSFESSALNEKEVLRKRAVKYMKNNIGE